MWEAFFKRISITDIVNISAKKQQQHKNLKKSLTDGQSKKTFVADHVAATSSYRSK